MGKELTDRDITKVQRVLHSSGRQVRNLDMETAHRKMWADIHLTRFTHDQLARKAGHGDVKWIDMDKLKELNPALWQQVQDKVLARTAPPARVSEPSRRQSREVESLVMRETGLPRRCSRVVCPDGCAGRYYFASCEGSYVGNIEEAVEVATPEEVKEIAEKERAIQNEELVADIMKDLANLVGEDE